MQSFKQDFIQSVKIIILALFIAVGTSYIFAWTAPTSTPPNGDVSAPINVGASGQSKVGGLILGTGISATGNGLIIAGGRVGIGNIAPINALDVTGKIKATVDVCTTVGGVEKCLSTVNSITGKDEYVICGDAAAYNAWNCRYRVNIFDGGFNCLPGYYLVEMHQSYNNAFTFIDAVRCRQL